jgi:hypothetical protein
MASFSVRVNTFTPGRNDLYHKFCDHYYFRVPPEQYPDSHTMVVDGKTITIVYERPGTGKEYHGYITLLDRDQEATSGPPTRNPRVPLVCIGSTKVQLTDISDNHRVIISQEYPERLIETLAKWFSTPRLHDEVIKIRESLREELESNLGWEDRIVELIEGISDSNALKTLARGYTVCIDEPHHCIDQVAPDLWEILYQSVKKRTGCILSISREESNKLQITMSDTPPESPIIQVAPASFQKAEYAYFNHVKPELKKANPELDTIELWGLAKENFRVLPQAEKDKWEAEAAKPAVSTSPQNPPPTKISVRRRTLGK